MAKRDFPKPGLGAIASAVTGAGPGGSLINRSGLAIEIDNYGTFTKLSRVYAGMIDKLGMSFKSFREPLEESLDLVVIPSIKKNFEAQGRPQWTPLAESTIKNRLYMGYPRGPILHRSGRLEREATRKNIWDIKSNELKLMATYFDQKVPYAQFHQSGTRFRTHSKRIRSLFTHIGRTEATSITETSHMKNVASKAMPARPFIRLTLDEEVEIHNIFTNFMVKQVNKYWAEGDTL